MKNKILKLVITFSFIFSFIPITYAAWGDECNILINEQEPTSWKTNWDANLRICDPKNSKIVGWSEDSFPTYSATKKYQDSWIYTLRESIDAKSVETVQIKRCDVADAYISASVKCTVKIKTNGRTVCTGRSQPKKSDGTCPAGYRNCISGNYCYTSSSWVEDEEEIDWSKDFKNVDSSFNALAECNKANNNNCTKCTSETYTLHCPKYACTPITEQLSTCTPTFRVGGNPAYCVNPNQGFAPKASNGNNYMVDKTFDINKCFNSSYKRTDCGYANILIEGKYHKIDEQQIQLALRLWGVHTGAGGYADNKTGVANVVGDSCGEYVTFIADEDVINIYKITHDYIWRIFFESLSNKLNNNEFKDGYINAGTPNIYFNETTCSGSRNSLVCGKLLNYSSAFALFFNTYFGNQFMQEHLYSLVGFDGVNTEPTSALVETTEEISRVEIYFDRDIKTQTNETFNCELLEKDKDLPEEKRKYKNLNSTLRDNILKYCNITVNHYYIFDEEGNRTEIKVDPNSKQWDNYKGSIQFETETFAACQVSNHKKYSHYELEVTYLKTKRVNSVEKYVACINPEDNQYLFAFNNSTESQIVPGESTQPDGTDKKVLQVDVNCANEGCENYTIRQDRTKCESQTEYNKTYSSSVKDPSLSCIVNMASSTNRAYYDYSDYFKVNKNLCRVYCSDEVNYHIAGRTEAKSGLSFKYDINQFDFKDNNKMFSSVIELERNCVSEIYYDLEFPSETEKELKELYGITDDFLNKKGVKEYFEGDEKPTIRTWKDLLYVLYKKASLEENNRSENLNQIIYDLYNCNFLTNIPKSITQPRDNKIGESYKYITDKLYSKDNNYGLTNPNTNNLDDMWLNNVIYEGGAEYINSNSSVGKNTSDIDMLNVKNVPKVSEVKYCKGDGGNCLPYNSKKEDYNYENIESFGSSNWATTGINISESSAKNSVQLNQLKKVLDTKIPANNYAMFSITTLIGFYNSSNFEIEPYSGKVNKIKGNANEDYAKLADYSYPLSKNAYNICKKTSKDTASCSVKQLFNNVSTYYRNRQNDELFKTLNGTNYREFSCDVAVDVKVPEVTTDNAGSKTIYRDINLSNIFPSGNRENSNWFTELGQNAIKDIQNSADSIIKDDYYLEYSFDLTPEAIKNIREYNTTKETQGGYLDNSLTNCTLTDGKYFNCQSRFITEIESGNSIYVDNTSPYNKFNGISKFTQNNNNSN